MSLTLDTFELTERIGRGGMAEVWRGIHTPSGASVAIKLVTADSARTRTLREAIQNEVRAMARLDHPGIVLVLDYGLVPAATERASQGAILQGSPYLVMELCDEGKLKKSSVRSWPDLKALLAELLRALAHAHARGVIHRDLKPSNVLMHGGRYKLGDFGIAHALGRGIATEAMPLSAGTAYFMAPEQVLGLHRDEGPWTDLYSLGCLAYLLATNNLPFRGDRDTIYRAHVLSEPPRMNAAFAVPPELDAWISVLMHKRPEDRFELAPDALAALEAMSEPPAAGKRASLPRFPASLFNTLELRS